MSAPLDPTALLTPAEMTQADALAIQAGIPGRELMERAGRAVADACLDLLGGDRRHAVVLCGPGNNGGDGFVAARLLQAAGWQVDLALLGERSRLSGDADWAASGWTGPIRAPTDVALAKADLILDALFGAGLSRPLEGQARALVERVNAAGCSVVAIDIPSGVDGTSGEIRGCAVAAALTVTFFREKPGHWLYPGAAKRGRLVLCDIGIPNSVLDDIKPLAERNGPDAWLLQFPWPGNDGHKYDRGHAVVLSGGASHTGAARLSARAALRVGAGLVTLASPSDAMAANAAHLTAVMLRESDGPDGLAAILEDGRKNVVVLGPGLGVGKATRALVEAALTTEASRSGEKPRAAVLDADALTSFEADSDGLGAMIGKARGPVVITPHAGEFGRLFEGRSEVADAGSKLDKARAAARVLGCHVLLKGPDTIVAEPGGRVSIADGGSPWLATAGSGDVLSGFIGGLLAQGMPAFEAASAAVWLHAETARRFGPGLIAEDLPDSLPGVLRDLHGMPRPA